MNVLSIRNVSKKFGGHPVLRDLTFEVSEHSVYGFIGQNGAGKTTTMKLILGLYQMDAGEILIGKVPVAYGNTSTNREIGYLPDVPEFYDYMKPAEYLTLCGRITGMSDSALCTQIGELLELVGLTPDKERKIRGFSRGMKQRLGIAQALLNKPKLLICDEPTSALDPIGRKEILEILESVKERTTVFFSTHILSDVERICDRIGFLKDGKLALETSMEEIYHMHDRNGFVIEFLRKQHTDQFLSHFQVNGLNPERVQGSRLIYHNAGEKEMYQAMNIVTEQALQIQKIELLEPTLESLFVEVVGR